MKDLPYSTQWIEDEDVEAVVSVLRSGWLTQGRATEAFEGALAELCGARHAVAVANGTAGLHLACLALGLSPGQRLVTSALTFVASANCALYCGARPAFTDVDPRTGNMTPETLGRALAREPADVVVPVHFAGRPAPMADLARVAGKATIIEDACHALGAELPCAGGFARVGRCDHSAATVFSFHPVKPITTGEGGAILTQDKVLARRLRALRSHGIVRDPARQAEQGGWSYEMRELGFNYRLTDIQAALGSAQLRRLDAGIERRRRQAERYRRELDGLSGLCLPPPEDGVRSSWHLFPVRIRHPRWTKRKVYDELRSRGILVQVHYELVPLQPFYRERWGYTALDFPEAAAYVAEELSLPLFATLSEADASRVIAALRELLG